VGIQENERRRIALDLHDGLGQSLSLIKHAVENASGLVQAGAADAAVEALNQLVPRVKEAISEVRRVCTDLRPSLLDDLGILLTLSWFFREFEASCPDISVEKVIGVIESDVPKALHITLYRILQEATHNSLKHAHASRISVALQRTGALLQLVIADNGDGFVTDRVAQKDGESHGLGLLSMRERATLSGGDFRLHSSPGQGTRIEIDWRIDS
jgi:signal transduction histidine kinase